LGGVFGVLLCRRGEEVDGAGWGLELDLYLYRGKGEFDEVCTGWDSAGLDWAEEKG
jgi:hypothetical protein